MGWFIAGLMIGGMVGVIVMAFCAVAKKADEKYICNECKYMKSGINIFTGEFEEPCAKCCHLYKDYFTERKV